MDAKSKKLYAIGGVIGVAVVGIIYLRNKNSSGSTPGTGNIDPSTGFPYGSAQDQAALAAQSGTGSEIDPSTGYPYGSPQDEAALAATGTGGAYPYQDSGAGYGYVPVPTTSGSPATNAAWSQAVEQTLTAIGYSPTDVSGAVGRYLAKLPLSETQANIIQVALAEEGNPPQGTYSIIPQPPSPVPGTPHPFPPIPHATVPNVVGLSQVEADKVLNSEGLKAQGTKETAKKGSVYVVTSQSPKAGSSVAKGSTVKLNAQVKK